MNNYKNKLALGLALLFFISTDVYAGDVADLINQLQVDFKNAVSMWYAPLKTAAFTILIALTTISLFWSSTQILIQGGGLSEIVASIIRLILWTGFWIWYIQNAQSLNETLIKGWIWLAGEATGTALTVNTGEILERGVDIAGQIWEVSSMAMAVVYGPIMLVVIALYALIAAQVFFILIEMYIVTAASVVILGFAGSSWTGDYAKKYLSYCMAVGMKLYVVFLIVGTGGAFVNNWAVGLDFGEMPSIFSLIGLLIILLVLVRMIPDTVQGMITGASMGSATPSIGGMASTAAKAVGGAAIGAAGATMAIREAAKMADSQPGSGFGTGANKAANMMGNLTKAAGNVAGGKIMGGYKASHGSFGGSMAQDLRSNRDAAMKSSGVPGGAMSAADVVREMQGIDVAGDFSPSAGGSIGGANFSPPNGGGVGSLGSGGGDDQQNNGGQNKAFGGNSGGVVPQKNNDAPSGGSFTAETGASQVKSGSVPQNKDLGAGVGNTAKGNDGSVNSGVGALVESGSASQKVAPSGGGDGVPNADPSSDRSSSDSGAGSTVDDVQRIQSSGVASGAAGSVPAAGGATASGVTQSKSVDDSAVPSDIPAGVGSSSVTSADSAPQSPGSMVAPSGGVTSGAAGSVPAAGGATASGVTQPKSVDDSAGSTETPKLKGLKNPGGVAPSSMDRGARAGDSFRSGAGGMSAGDVMQSMQGVGGESSGSDGAGVGSYRDDHQRMRNEQDSAPGYKDDLERMAADKNKLKRVKLPPRPDK